MKGKWVLIKITSNIEWNDFAPSFLFSKKVEWNEKKITKGCHIAYMREDTASH